MSFADGAVILREGAKDRAASLYFVTGGGVRISKRLPKDARKDLALYGPGDCFGEMEVVDSGARSAQASAIGPTTLLRLPRKGLARWLESRPGLAGDFYSSLASLLSRNLRRSSYELSLVCDLSRLLLEPYQSGPELLSAVLANVAPQLEGSWSAAATLRNLFNEEPDFVGIGGKASAFAAFRDRFPPESEARDLWLSDRAYYASLPGRERPLGFLLLRSGKKLGAEERLEFGRIFTTIARFSASALENVYFRVDESLRKRLKDELACTEEA